MLVEFVIKLFEMKKLLIYTSIFFCIAIACTPTNQLTSKRTLSPDMPQGPGCYAKSKVIKPGEKISEDYIKYTGDDYKNPNVEFVRKEIQPATEKWEKKKTDNCLSANPEDCLVWCLVKEDAIVHEYYTVRDTNLVKDFKIEKFEATTSTQTMTEWKAVICDNEINEEFVAELTHALNERGYSIKLKKRMTSALKTTVLDFQKEYNLPQGQLDHATLDALGVSYRKF